MRAEPPAKGAGKSQGIRMRLAVWSEATEIFGERGRNRTFNLLIKSQLLCQLSYAPLVCGKNGRCFRRRHFEFNTSKRLSPTVSRAEPDPQAPTGA